MATTSRRMGFDEDDEEPIHISQNNDVINRAETLCLIGKVWTQKPFNVFGLLDTMKKLWNPLKGMVGQEIESNLFSFQFNSKRDMERVLWREPWHFNKHLLVLKRVEPNMQPSTIILDSVPFWIRIYDLPMVGRGITTIKQIKNRLGEFLEWDDSTNEGLSGNVRIKMLINLTRPLKRGTKIYLAQSDPIWLPITYERLPSFCYGCGMFGHIMRDCDLLDDSCLQDKRDDTNLPFGEWLRVSSVKHASVVFDEGFQSRPITAKVILPSSTKEFPYDKDEKHDNSDTRAPEPEAMTELTNTLQRVDVSVSPTH
ncbi:hypothetical protein C2S51_030048 [Perilla frutescens var. frutescens]|nr:hypothetical protein C2S51_030048 [Perilla frutescens var. frutescens]